MEYLCVLSVMLTLNFCCYSVAQSCLTLCDPISCSTLGFPVLQRIWNLLKLMSIESFPGGASSKELTCQCGRHKTCRFDPWVEEILWKEGMATHSSILGLPWWLRH